MDQLAAMRTFVAVAERGGFVAAGRRLGLSGPMVGNHVRFLEAQLGGLILNRTTRAQSLTELGRTYLDGCRRVFAELDAAEADAAALLGAARGSLKVTAPHSIGSTILPPAIAAFLSENPLVDVHLHLDDRRVDLLSDGFDVAIRSGHVEDAGLITALLRLLNSSCAQHPAISSARASRSPRATWLPTIALISPLRPHLASGASRAQTAWSTSGLPAGFGRTAASPSRTPPSMGLASSCSRK